MKSKPNDEQQAAIDYNSGPMILLAGAGSGKTFTLTAKVRALIAEGIAPERILGITFTNKAANELKERLEIEEGGVHPRVGTIHSLALWLIRKDPTKFGLGPKVTPIDDYDQKTIVETILEKLKDEELKAWNFLEKTKFHRARGIGFSPDYTPEVHAQALQAYGGYMALTEKELNVWTLYEKEKAKQGVVDFDDMLHLVVKRGNEDPVWLRRIQGYYDYILVDEAQDTNVVQWALINNFFGPTNFNLCAVGDLSQSIYGFAGASPDILYGYTQSWRGQTPKLFKLERNHRSVPEVVGLANRIQKTMTETVPLRMESFRGNQGERGFTGMITSPTQLQLAEEIAASIDRDRKRMHLRNFAILVRSGSQVKDIEPALVKRKIPYLIRGASGFLQSQEVKDVLAYLRVAVNPRDYAAFERSATTPKRGVGPAALEKIRDKSDEHEGDLIGTCEDKGTLLLYTTLIRKVQEMKEDPVACLDYIIKHTGYMKYLEEKACKVKGRVDKDKLEMKTNNLNRLKETFQALLDTSNLTLDDIVFQLAMNGDKDVEDEEGKVIISTIHASKGLEWPVVYVFGVVEGQLPHKYSQSAKEIEEERRVAYVACTRSRDRLLLCVPGCIKTPYSETMVSPSRFLYEWGVLKR